MQRICRFVLAVIAAVLPLYACAAAPVDYSPAFSFYQRFDNKVLNERLDPHWLDFKSSDFWYAEKQKDGSEIFWQVSPKTGQKKRLDSPPEKDGKPNRDEKKFPRWRDVIQPQKEYNIDSNAAKKRYGLFVKDFNVWAKDIKNDTEFPLTSDGVKENFYTDDFIWSNDGQKLITVKFQPEETHTVFIVQSSPQEQTQPKLFSHQYLKPGDKIAQKSLTLFNFENKENPLAPIPVDLSPRKELWRLDFDSCDDNSEQFRFVFNQRGHQRLGILSINACSGDVKMLFEDTSKTFIDYSSKFFCSSCNSTNEFVWMSERSGWNHLYLFNVKENAMSPVTAGNWNVRRVERLDWKNRKVYFSLCGFYPEQDPYYVHFASCNLDGSDFKMLTLGDGTHFVRWSPDREFFIDSYSRVDSFPRHELRSRTGGLILDLGSADGSALLEAGWRFPQRFCAKGRDGKTDIYGVIYRPVDYDKSKKYPVIESIYAGPQDFFTPKGFQWFNGMMELAQMGFIVVECDGMGTNWRGKAFHDVCWRNLKDAGFPDRIAWIKAAAKQDPAMDVSRVGVYGCSAGGQNAAAAVIWFNDFYKAAVADCGCHDNRMDKIWWNEQWFGYPVEESVWEENSNTTNAHLFKGNLLLLLGEMDKNVDPASTMQLVNALVKADKDFDMFIVPNNDHGTMYNPVVKRKVIRFFTDSLK